MTKVARQSSVTDIELSVTELLIVIYPTRKAWSFSTSISVVVSLVVAAIWRVRLSRSLLLFILTQRACHDGLTVHTASTILCVSKWCQPSSPRRKTTASFFSSFLSLSQTRVSVMFSEWATLCMEQGLGLGTWLSWLSLPVATVTDVLFNTRAGSGSGWSEYKLAHCLLEGECTANVATKYFTCKLILLQLGLMGHLCFSCYFTCFLLQKTQRRAFKWSILHTSMWRQTLQGLFVYG